MAYKRKNSMDRKSQNYLEGMMFNNLVDYATKAGRWKDNEVRKLTKGMPWYVREWAKMQTAGLTTYTGGSKDGYKKNQQGTNRAGQAKQSDRGFDWRYKPGSGRSRSQWENRRGYAYSRQGRKLTYQEAGIRATKGANARGHKDTARRRR